ncbi:hypothetical protein ACIP8U_25065 [Streptomyces pseudovenezuelae]|uniref:hypothetical protein n=1 Tax=Streptomyces pseudovenezuelae TaxID=67350 RepID=UPI00381EE9A8
MRGDRLYICDALYASFASFASFTSFASFASKDHLVATAVADRMCAQHANIVAQTAPGRAGLKQLVR